MYNKKDPQKVDSLISDKTISFISENVLIEGNLKSSSGIIELLGKVSGDCFVDNFTIRESGVVDGNVTSINLKVKGTINGNVKADNIKLFSTGKIIGNLSYNIISIEDNGEIDGNCKRYQKEQISSLEKKK